MSDDANFRFILGLKQENSMMLPLLHKIKNRTLNLTGYMLSPPLARALSQCFKKQDTILNRAIFDNNGLRDEEFGLILTGLAKLQDMKSLIYNNNELGLKAVEALVPIVSLKTLPYHLEELRIVNCKVTGLAMTKLLNAINEKSYLKKLALVNA